MEIADIFVVNKADREGADRTVASIEGMLSLQSFGEGQWRPPIVKTEASAGKGIVDLLDAIERFRQHTAPTERERRRVRAEWRVRDLLAHRFVRHVHERVLGPGEFGAMLDRIAAARDGSLQRRGRHPRESHRREGRPDGDEARMKAILDHVGIAVADLDAALRFYRDALGLEVAPPEDVAIARRAGSLRRPRDRSLGSRAGTPRGDQRGVADRAVPRPNADPAFTT